MNFNFKLISSEIQIHIYFQPTYLRLLKNLGSFNILPNNIKKWDNFLCSCIDLKMIIFMIKEFRRKKMHIVRYETISSATLTVLLHCSFSESNCTRNNLMVCMKNIAQ
jgi:hypothetical protein